MNEEDIGKAFLIALPWDWTIVGRFRGYVGGMMIFDQAGYFTRPGATFDKLCKSGFVAETIFNTFGDGMRVRIDANLILPWSAPWPQKARAK